MQSNYSGKTSQTAKKQPKLTKAERKAAKDMAERKSKFLNTTRWLPDSAFTTYFGKPAFHTYGRGNTEPTVGGINYGHSMLTHNINAECGENPPLYQQVYDSALRGGIEKTKGFRVTQIPNIKQTEVDSQEKIDMQNARKPIMPKQLRSTKKGEKAQATIEIAKPEMTLQNFVHTHETFDKKERLVAGIEVRRMKDIDVVSKSNRSKSSRRGSRRSSSRGGVSHADDDDDSQYNRDIA